MAGIADYLTNILGPNAANAAPAWVPVTGGYATQRVPAAAASAPPMAPAASKSELGSPVGNPLFEALAQGRASMSPPTPVIPAGPVPSPFPTGFEVMQGQLGVTPPKLDPYAYAAPAAVAPVAAPAVAPVSATAPAAAPAAAPTPVSSGAGTVALADWLKTPEAQATMRGHGWAPAAAASAPAAAAAPKVFGNLTQEELHRAVGSLSGRDMSAIQAYAMDAANRLASLDTKPEFNAGTDASARKRAAEQQAIMNTFLQNTSTVANPNLGLFGPGFNPQQVK
jgi:hypothetical protein